MESESIALWASSSTYDHKDLLTLPRLRTQYGALPNYEAPSNHSHVCTGTYSVAAYGVHDIQYMTQKFSEINSERYAGTRISAVQSTSIKYKKQ